MNHSATTAKSVLGNLLSLSKPATKTSSKPALREQESGRSNFTETLAGVGDIKTKAKMAAPGKAQEPSAPARHPATGSARPHNQVKNRDARTVVAEKSNAADVKNAPATTGAPDQLAVEKTADESRVNSSAPGEETQQSLENGGQDLSPFPLMAATGVEISMVDTTNGDVATDGRVSGQILPPTDAETLDLMVELPMDVKADTPETVPAASEGLGQAAIGEVSVEAPSGAPAITSAPGETVVSSGLLARSPLQGEAKGEPAQPLPAAAPVDFKTEAPSPSAGPKTGMEQAQALAADNDISVDNDVSVGPGLEALAKSSRLKQANSSTDSSLPTRAMSQAAPALEAITRATESLAPTGRGFVVQTPVGPSVGHPQWNQAVGDKVLWLAAQKISAAELRLDPPELGPMQVRVSVHQDQVQVTFTSPHANVREALDQGASRLREMFNEQGLSLNVEVSDQSLSRRQGQGEANNHSRSAAATAEDETAVAETVVANHRLIDHYA